MSIRKNTIPRQLDLNPELQDILVRNGLQGRITDTSQGLMLVVQGHDSPLLSYAISEQQLRALTSWGTNSDNKKAYGMLTSIIGDDFHLPRDFVHARNANGRVAMGLHGYRIGTGDQSYGREQSQAFLSYAERSRLMGESQYGRPMHGGYNGGWGAAWHGWHGRDPGGYCHPILGWTPRQQEGFHMRRINGALFYPSMGAPMVSSRPDGHMKPGELQNGGYGFYWKGTYNGNDASMQPQQPQDVLDQLVTVITPLQIANRPEEPAAKYKDVITSDVYFSWAKFDEILRSHGIAIDTENKTLCMQSKSVPLDMRYDLTEEEISKLTNDSLKDVPMADRLALINDIIKVDFTDSVTMDTLNSDKLIDLHLTADRQQELDSLLNVQQAVFNQARQEAAMQNVPFESNGLDSSDRDGAVHMNGSDLYYINPEKGWFREGRHGREVTVEDIRVGPAEQEGKYRMSAVIDGQVASYEISQKQYDKFLAIDDYHRMKMFSKIFKEVDMKDRHPVGAGIKVAAGLMAGLTVVGEIGGLLRSPRPMPHVYEEHYRGSVYMKPGVDSPQDIAHRAFEAGMNTANIQNDLRRGF